MMIRDLRFNIYFLLAGALALVAGCKSSSADYSEKDEASLRLYVEVTSDGSDRSAPVMIGRERPFQLNLEKKTFLTEFNVDQAAVVDTVGGFSISVQYDKQGTWLLEQYTTANKGRHIGIAGEFGQMRWLAAPVIERGISDGLLVFAPDATREECERLVSGLNRVAELVRKGRR
jgi:hypothetical protein